MNIQQAFQCLPQLSCRLEKSLSPSSIPLEVVGLVCIPFPRLMVRFCGVTLTSLSLELQFNSADPDPLPHQTVSVTCMVRIYFLLPFCIFCSQAQAPILIPASLFSLTYIRTASSDSDFFVNDTLPYVLAFQKTGTRYTLQWLTNLGQAQVNTLGSASPIVRSGLTNDEAEVYSSSYTGAVAIVAGQSCPFYKGVECGPNNGVCNCATGKCACQPLLYCNQGPGCGDTCNGNGECSLVRGGTFSCKCSPCWTGPTCSQYSQSSCSPSNSFLKTPAGQAAVGVPVTLLLLCIIGIAMWRVMYPNAPWASLFPKWLGCCGPHSESAPLLAAGDDSVEKSTGKGYGLVPQIPGQVESTL